MNLCLFSALFRPAWNQWEIIENLFSFCQDLDNYHKHVYATSLKLLMNKDTIHMQLQMRKFLHQDTSVFIRSFSLRSFSWKWFTVVCSSFFMYFSLDKSDRGWMLGSCSTLFLLPPKVKQRAIPVTIIPIKHVPYWWIISALIIYSGTYSTNCIKTISILYNPKFWRKITICQPRELIFKPWRAELHM